MRRVPTKLILFLLCAIAVVACDKKYGYEFADGINPGGDQETITVDTTMSMVDSSLFAKARIFPGLVSELEPRLDGFEVQVDLNYVPTKDLRVNFAPYGIHSVGLYAPPGELIKVVVPEGIEGLTIQIGAHTDNLTGKAPLRRDPVIYNVKALFPGANYIRNLYGGVIWITSRQPVKQPVKFTFSGAVKSPDFIVGESQDAEWLARVESSHVPWLELRSKHAIFTMQRELLLRLIKGGVFTSPTAIMKEWNTVYEKDYYNWMGLTSGNVNPKHRAPDLPERGVLDVQVFSGSGHSGYPWMAQLGEEWASEWVNLHSIRAGESWGTYHEVGHNYQQANWSWASLEETTNNLFIFKGAQRNGSFPSHPALQEQFPLALAFAAQEGLKNFDENENAYFKLLPFVQLFNLARNPLTSEPGWGIMTSLYTKTRDAKHLSANVVDQKDFFYETVCDFTQMDYAAFFDAWGIAISGQSRSKIKAKGYSKLTKELWKYNPISKEGGDTAIPTKVDYPKSDWTAVASSFANDGGFTIEMILDGNAATFWHSEYAPSEINPPHSFTVDMKAAKEVKGFYFIQRQGGSRAAMEVRIQVSNDELSWEELGTYPLQQIDSRQEVVLPALKTFRYVKVFFDSNSYDGSVFANMAEFGTFYDQD